MGQTDNSPRGIVVLDQGATHTRLVLFDHALNMRAEQSRISAQHDHLSYAALDLDSVIAFAREVIPQFDVLLPVDVVVPCAHGSALALLNETNALALPVMAYTAEPPADVTASYARLAPPFDEVFARTNPAALTLGMQLHWQETIWPDSFASAVTIQPLAQYLGYLLGGRAVSEVTSLGAQTHLWAPMVDAPSALAQGRGWADRLAPCAPAWSEIGHLDSTWRGAGFQGRGKILAGIHDSSASFLRHTTARSGRTALLSTGTWIIGFDDEADPGGLNPDHDTATNSTIQGKPVACCRFKGGAEFAAIAGDADPGLATQDTVSGLIARGVMALPSFTDSGGPAPGTGGLGRIVGTCETEADRAGLAALYCALMSALSLGHVWGANPAPTLIVDGPFAENRAFLQCLAGLLPDTEIHSSTNAMGTAAGAALLAFADTAGTIPAQPATTSLVAPVALPGLPAYAARWRVAALRDG